MLYQHVGIAQHNMFIKQWGRRAVNENLNLSRRASRSHECSFIGGYISSQS